MIIRGTCSNEAVDQDGEIILTRGFVLPEDGRVPVLDRFDSNKEVGHTTRFWSDDKGLHFEATLNALPAGQTCAAPGGIFIRKQISEGDDRGERRRETAPITIVETRLYCLGLTDKPTNPTIKPFEIISEE